MEILEDNKDFAVVIKPVGLDSELGVPAALGGQCFPVHRLDLNVGGVMVYGRSKAGAAALSKAVQDGVLVKCYCALVHGQPEQEGVFEDFLWKDTSKNKVFVVKKERKGVKKAKLSYTVLERRGDTSLVKIRLYTGRSHQIRVQFASRGFPLVGDHKYGSRDTETAPMLFSHSLTFALFGKQYHFEAMPPWAKI